MTGAYRLDLIDEPPALRAVTYAEELRARWESVYAAMWRMAPGSAERRHLDLRAARLARMVGPARRKERL